MIYASAKRGPSAWSTSACCSSLSRGGCTCLSCLFERTRDGLSQVGRNGELLAVLDCQRDVVGEFALRDELLFRAQLLVQRPGPVVGRLYLLPLHRPGVLV